MKKEIKGKEYNVRAITLGDLDEFSDYLKEQKLKVCDKVFKGDSDTALEPELMAVLKQVGLSRIDIETLRALESQLKIIQSKRTMINKILSEPISFQETFDNMNSIKGGRFIIWLSIKDNGVTLDDIDAIVDHHNFREIFDFIEALSFPKKDESKNEEKEVENPSPSN